MNELNKKVKLLKDDFIDTLFEKNDRVFENQKALFKRILDAGYYKTLSILVDKLDEKIKDRKGKEDEKGWMIWKRDMHEARYEQWEKLKKDINEKIEYERVVPKNIKRIISDIERTVEIKEDLEDIIDRAERGEPVIETREIKFEDIRDSRDKAPESSMVTTPSRCSSSDDGEDFIERMESLNEAERRVFLRKKKINDRIRDM